MYFFIIVGILFSNYILGLIVDILNLGALRLELPDEFKSYYDPERYSKAQRYLRENTFFAIIHSTLTLLILVSFIAGGFFNVLDQFARVLAGGEVLRGLIFIGAFYFIFQIIPLKILNMP